MSLPAKSVAWIYSFNNRITYASLLQVARDLLFLIKQTLKANGYTVKGSSNGTTGGMDGVDRWTTAADAGTRGTTTTTPISWVVLTDGNGTDILFAYIGATDDVFRLNVSHAGDYVVAATATHQPTSANETATGPGWFTAAIPSMIGTATSADRVAHIWIAPDATGFRVALFRSAVLLCAFGVDKHEAATYAPSVVVSAAHGFFFNGAVVAQNFPFDAASTAGTNAQFRIVVRTSMGGKLASCCRSVEAQGYGLASANFMHLGQDFIPELQGAGFQLKRIGICSVSSAQRGKVGNLRDWWIGRALSGVSDGDTYGSNREFVCIDGESGVVWPWDGTSTTLGSAISIS